MHLRVLARPRPLALLLLVALVLLGFGFGFGLVPLPAARADTRPPSSSTPITASTDVLPTAQIDGVAWTQLIVGGTVYVGGSFTTARPAGAASGASTVARRNMLAYDLTTGALKTGFAPSFDGEVRGIAASADGRTLYVGGAFTTVNGVRRYRLAAVDATTGAVQSTFQPVVNSTVMTVVRAGGTLYFGGKFTAVAGATRAKAAAVTTSGAVTAWSPRVTDGIVRAVVVDPSATRVVLGGNFSGLNGVNARPYQGSGMVDATNGTTNLPWSVGRIAWNHGTGSAIMSLTSDGSRVYGTGYVYNAGNDGNLEGAFSAGWSDGAVRWIEDCHGDSYSVAVLGAVAYTAGHAHFCGNIGGFPQETPSVHHRGIAFTTAATGVVARNTEGTYPSFGGNPAPTLLDWFPDFNAGTYTGQNQGPWSVATTTDWVTYAGEFTTINGRPQQGLSRFAVPMLAPNRDGPRIGGDGLKPVLTASGSTVRIAWTSSWDRDNESLTYRVFRGSTQIATVSGPSTFWRRPTLSVTDSGRSGTVSYRVTATDPWGNAVTGTTASITVG